MVDVQKLRECAYPINGEGWFKNEDILELLDRLEAAEKNAARFEWLMCNAKMGIGQWGKEWDLQIVDQPFSAPNHIGEVPAFIDAAIKQEKQK